MKPVFTLQLGCGHTRLQEPVPGLTGEAILALAEAFCDVCWRFVPVLRVGDPRVGRPAR